MSQAFAAAWPGKPYPLGATWDGEGVNFSLFSEHGHRFNPHKLLIEPYAKNIAGVLA